MDPLPMEQLPIIIEILPFLANGLKINASTEYKLRLEILASMDVMVRPVKSHSDVTNVSFSLVIRSLNGLVRVTLIYKTYNFSCIELVMQPFRDFDNLPWLSSTTLQSE